MGKGVGAGELAGDFINGTVVRAEGVCGGSFVAVFEAIGAGHAGSINRQTNAAHRKRNTHTRLR